MKFPTRTICLTLIALVTMVTVLPARVVFCLGCDCGVVSDLEDVSASDSLPQDRAIRCQFPGCPKCQARRAAAARRAASMLESTFASAGEDSLSSPSGQKSCAQLGQALASGEPSRCPGCVEISHEVLDLDSPKALDPLRWSFKLALDLPRYLIPDLRPKTNCEPTAIRPIPPRGLLAPLPLRI